MELVDNDGACGQRWSLWTTMELVDNDGAWYSHGVEVRMTGILAPPLR
jgi:hypothetical protein